ALATGNAAMALFMSILAGLSSTLTFDEFKTALLAAAAEGTTLGDIIRELLASKEYTDKQSLINDILMAIATGSVMMGEFLLILSGIDTGEYEDALALQEALIEAAGGENTKLGQIIKGIDATNMTKEELIAATLNAIARSGLTLRAMRILMKLSKGIDEYTSIEGVGGIKTELLALAAGDEELIALINSIIITPGMTVEEFIAALKEKLGLDEEGEALLTLLLAMEMGTIDTAQELQLLLIKQYSGTDAAVEALINMLLGLDLSGFATPEDLLNMLILLLGGPVLTELKDKLVAMGSAVGSATSAVTLLNSLTDVSTDLANFRTQIIALIPGTLTDAEVLAALKDLAAGRGAAPLVRLIINKVSDPAIRNPLVTLISGGNTNLFNLLSKINTEPETRLASLLSAVNPDIYPDVASLKAALIQEATDRGSSYEDLLRIINKISIPVGMTKDGLINEFKKQTFLMEMMNVDTDSDTYPDLVEIMLGFDPNSSVSKPDPSTSLVYRYEVKADAKLKAQTFYVIDKQSGQTPQSVIDYTLTYYQDGTTLRETTVYYYEDPDSVLPEVRASYVSSNENPTKTIRDCRKVRSVTYRDDARSSRVDHDNDGWSDRDEELAGTNPYSNASEPTGTPPTDHSDDVDMGGAGDGIKDSVIMKSQTFFAFIVSGANMTIPGDEVSNYSYNYAPDGTTVKTTSVYEYEEFDGNNNLRAGYYSRAISALPGAALRRTTTYKRLADVNNLAASTKTSETYYVNARGEENADYSTNFSGDPATVRNYTIFFYGTGNGVRASAADVDAAMVRSETRKTSISGALQTETFYSTRLGKGDEISNYSWNYMLSQSVVKSTTFYYYNNRLATDPSVTVDDAMNKSMTYKGQIITETENELKLQSITYYQGGKGDEVSDYSYNYLVGTTAVKNTSVFIYGTTYLRAISAGTELAMTRSLSYKGDIGIGSSVESFYDISGNVLNATSLQSETYYFGDVRGDEIAWYAYNMRLGTTSVRNVSVYYYNDLTAN
ncbi:MAG: hypothetical protein KBB52_05565, partial [Candidatus Omnitrophica bacterium]|nr:hypothetical protein [Candidatus Omnitrophota bacterium]